MPKFFPQGQRRSFVLKNACFFKTIVTVQSSLLTNFVREQRRIFKIYKSFQSNTLRLGGEKGLSRRRPQQVLSLWPLFNEDYYASLSCLVLFVYFLFFIIDWFKTYKNPSWFLYKCKNILGRRWCPPGRRQFWHEDERTKGLGLGRLPKAAWVFAP